MSPVETKLFLGAFLRIVIGRECAALKSRRRWSQENELRWIVEIKL